MFEVKLERILKIFKSPCQGLDVSEAAKMVQMVAMVNQMEPLQVVEASGAAMVGVSVACVTAFLTAFLTEFATTFLTTLRTQPMPKLEFRCA
jgi:hypothetical protein